MRPEAAGDSLVETSAPEPIDPVQKERIRDLFLSIEKALRLMRLYDSANKNYLGAIDELAVKFKAYLEEAGELLVTVTAEGFQAGDDLHLKGAKSEASVPFRLFRDGVRSLRFTQGFEREELHGLLEALETPADSAGRIDEDMATILWRQNFRHLDVGSVDEIGLTASRGGGKGESPGIGSELSGKLEEMLDTIKSSLFPAGAGNQEGGRTVAAGELDLLEMQRLARPSARGEEGGEELQLDEAAIAQLRSELEQDGDGGFVRRVVDIFTHVFLSGPSTLAPEEGPEILWCLLRDLLERGDLAGVNGVLERLSAGLSPSAADPGRELLRGILEQLASEESLGLVLAAARAKPGSDGEPFLRLFARLPSGALKHLARQMRTLESGKVKEAWHQILLTRGQEDPAALFVYLEHEGGERAVAAVRTALSSGEIPGATSILRKLLAHGEERVRLDTLKACSALTGSLRRGLLEISVADPSFKVRVAALRAVEVSGDRGFIPFLAKRLEECGEGEEEPVRLVHAIATLGGERAVECLRGFLVPRSRRLPFGLRSGGGPHWRRAAIVALHDITDPAVRGLLSEGASMSDRTIAEAYRDSLAKFLKKGKKDR